MEVQLSGAILCGFLFLILNGVVILWAGVMEGKGNLAPKFAYVGGALYLAYVVTAVTVAFKT